MIVCVSVSEKGDRKEKREGRMAFYNDKRSVG